MRRSGPIVCALALLACEEEAEPEGDTEAMVESTGDVAPWWLGVFHDASLPVGSNASLLFVGNLELRDDGTATGTTRFCDDEPVIAEYTWAMDGASVVLAGDPLMWEGGEVGSIELLPGVACDELEITVGTLDGSMRNATFARGATCLQTTGPSCEVEVVWCDGEPEPCT